MAVDIGDGASTGAATIESPPAPFDTSLMKNTAPRMTIVGEREPAGTEATCSSCRANCCRLEVPLIGDVGVPDEYVEVDARGARTMARLDDGWCAALDRSTLLCGIYDDRPLICREFEMGGWECLAERS